MDGDEIVKVLDFGIAKELNATADTVKTASDALVGSPRYMSPEQVRGGAVDHRLRPVVGGGRRPVGDDPEGIANVDLRVEAVELAGRDEGEDVRGAVVAADEEPRVAPDRDGPEVVA